MCVLFLPARSQERDVARQVDGGDGGREENSAVRAHVPHDGRRSRALDGQARHVSETVLGKMSMGRGDD